MKAGLQVSTAFTRIREKDRQNEAFVPTHVPAFPVNNGRTVAGELRTYLREFVQHIQSAGFTLNRDNGLMAAGNLPVATTEADIYAALNLEFPAPSDRLDFRPQIARPV